MNNAITNLKQAMQLAIKIRPKVGGFPYLAEVFRQAGVQKNIRYLPANQSIYIMDIGNVVTQDTPLLNGMADIPKFERGALIRALRADQEGLSTFPEFLQAAWLAGTTSYEVDFIKRVVVYYGINGASYTEYYAEVSLA